MARWVDYQLEARRRPGGSPTATRAMAPQRRGAVAAPSQSQPGRRPCHPEGARLLAQRDDGTPSRCGASPSHGSVGAVDKETD